MKLIKLLIILMLSFSTIALAAADEMNSGWDMPCDEDECTPQSSQTKKKMKRIVAFSSYSYKKIQREILARHPKIGVAVGASISRPGLAQDIPVLGCLGDSLSVSNNYVTGGILGITVYADSLEFESDDYALKYAVSTYYLSPISVGGDVIQEQLVNNLDYSYTITNVASYAGLRLISRRDGKRCNFTFDAGVGINQVSTNFFLELPKVAYALPDNAFRGTNINRFSYMFGAGFQIQEVFGKSPLGCGYTFLFLGEGEMTSINPRIPATLKTGNNYANAITCSVELG